MLIVGTSVLAADNATPLSGLRGPAGGAEIESEPAPREREPAPSEEETTTSPALSAPARSNPIIEELTRTGELSDEIISSDEAKIQWDGGTNPGLQWEDYNELKYPELTRLAAGSKGFDFLNEPPGEAVSDKALDPLRYTYINKPSSIYSTVKKYINSVADYDQPRAWFDLDPTTIKSRYIRLAVRNYITPAQWDYLYQAVLYARIRGVKIKIWRVR
jgi:hypothetical protein